MMLKQTGRINISAGLSPVYVVAGAASAFAAVPDLAVAVARQSGAAA